MLKFLHHGKSAEKVELAGFRSGVELKAESKDRSRLVFVPLNFCLCRGFESKYLQLKLNHESYKMTGGIWSKVL